MTENAKPNTAPNNWRRLHELVLKAKAAKDFETLGAAMEELCGMTAVEEPKVKDDKARLSFRGACFDALRLMEERIAAWQKDPPPLGPVEAPIGPGNPLPPPPPPDKIVLTPEEVYVALNEGVGGVSLGAGDGPIYTAHAERLNALIAKKLSDANRHTIAHAKPWTAEEFDRLIDKPYYRTILGSGILHERSALCARIINERCGLTCGGEPAESAAEPVKTLVPWTGETLYVLAKERETGSKGIWSSQNDYQQCLWNKAACVANERMGTK